MNIPEIDAKNILLVYEGANNQLLEWKLKFLRNKNFKLTRSQAEYVLKFHEIVPKVARKHIMIVSSFGEKLQEDKQLPNPVEKIWCEKLLCETEKAYHIWGKYFDNESLKAIWLPKGAVLQPEKKLKREIDYSKYSHRPPKPWQPKAIESLLANNRFILADDMGLGKGLSINELVITPKGKVEIGKLKAGDEVIGSNGKKCKIIGVFPQGVMDLYRITFNDGYSILADKSHLFKVYSSNFGKNTKNNREEKDIILSVEQMMDKDLVLEINGSGYNKDKKYKFSTYYKVKNGDSKWQIPMVDPIEFDNTNPLPIDPYLFGLFLGDGYLDEKKIRFSVHKDDYNELFESYNLHPIECRTRPHIKTGYINVGDILEKLNIQNCRSNNKFIPDIYKYSSIENRISLLQGLMDTDGYCAFSKTGSFLSTEYSTISERLCDDLIEIVHSLGGVARKRTRRSFYVKNGTRKECNISYRVNMKLAKGMNPFRLKRKAERYHEPEKYQVGRYIKDIKFEKQGESVCIAVDSPDKLYVVNHGIVTHNTTSAIIAALESEAKKILIVCPASVKINWKREIKNYTDRPVLIVEGRKWGSTFDFYIINYDILKNYHTTKKNDEENDINLIQKENFELVIVDEAHYLSNPSSQRTKLMNDILKKIPKVWLLTGTPMTNRPINYYNLLKIVNSPVALNWQHYVKRYCKGFRFKAHGRTIWNTSGHSNLDELRERTKNIVLRRLKTEIPGLPEKTISPIFLELQSTFYNEELEEFMRIAEDERKKESIAITINRLVKVRQIIANEKIPYTCELIDKCLELNKKVIVFTNFTLPLDMLHEKYPRNSVIYDGRMSPSKRDVAIDKFQNDPKIKILIGNIIAAGIGINLTAAEVVIMNDLSFVPSHHSQAEDRACRHGQQNNVLIYYPIFENTIEQIIYNILMRKKDVIDQVMGDGEYSESFGKELMKELF
jgi:hypothetical protein